MSDSPPVSGPFSGGRRIVLVTGLSGAGMSSALKALEDLGYEAVDNLPLSLGGSLARQGGDTPVAMALDSRTWGFSAGNVLQLLDELLALPDTSPELLFLECQDDILQRRFTETRRRHPLATDRPVADGIAHERSLLAPLRSRADVVLDTSALSIHDLRRILSAQYGTQGGGGPRIFVTSFAFRGGVPREADLVFDVRFLDNPHYDPALRPLTGLDSAVADRVAADPDYALFFQNMVRLLEPLLPRYVREGKNYLTIAVGCTGGRHRSVFVAQQLGLWLQEKGYRGGVRHRELSLPDPARSPEDRSTGQ
ncbi:MAG: RNase adapter RapZ [Pseudomonadota bacterium]|nr:RNase adapter RapZ [Pseudomonadota bacterium]